MSDRGETDPETVADNFQGTADNYDQYVVDYVDSVGMEGISNLEYYFDTESFGSDSRINASSEEEEEYNYDDYNDEELGEFLIELYGGYSELSDRTKEIYFDYDKFGRDLGFDLDVINYDGQVYVFNSNYARGGQLKAFAKGGSIENNYGDQTAKEVWNNWSSEQRRHFLDDHNVIYGKDKSLHISQYRFDELPIDLYKSIESVLKKHLKEGQYAKGGELETFAVGGKVGSEITFNSWDDEKRMGTIQEVLDDGSYAVSVDTGMVLVYPSDVVEYNKPVERKKLFGIFANGGGIDPYELQDLKRQEYVLEQRLLQVIDGQEDGWRIDVSLIDSELDLVRNEISKIENSKYANGGRTNERRHVNKSEDYEVRYAKNHPHRKGYRGNEKFAKGGTIDSDREKLMNLLENKYNIRSVRTTEDFNGVTEGIWIAGDNGEVLSGNKIFDYYNRSAKYTRGVLNSFRNAIEKMGWRFEWNDPATIMLYHNNNYAKGGSLKKKELTKGDRVIWKGNVYVLSNVETNMKGGFYDNKYYLTSYKVGVSDAILDSLKDVEEYAKGGTTDEEYIDYFEDSNLAPPEVQKILNKHSKSLIDGDYIGLEKAKNELEKIGYTFEYYLDGIPYDLRPIGTKGKSEMYE
jgi:hypothetical protein